MQLTHTTAVVAEPPVLPGPINVAATLRQAADYLWRYGRTTRSLYENPGLVGRLNTPCACLVGALAVVTFGYPVESPVMRTDEPAWPDFVLALVWMDQYLDEMYEQDCYQFNDDPARSTEEVLVALRHAAVLWERIEGAHA